MTEASYDTDTGQFRVYEPGGPNGSDRVVFQADISLLYVEWTDESGKVYRATYGTPGYASAVVSAQSEGADAALRAS